MRHLPSSCNSREQASPTRCGKNIVVACLANDCPCRPARHQLLPLMSRSISLSRKKTRVGLIFLTRCSLPAFSNRAIVLTLTRNRSATSRRVRSRSTFCSFPAFIGILPWRARLRVDATNSLSPICDVGAGVGRGAVLPRKRSATNPPAASEYARATHAQDCAVIKFRAMSTGWIQSSQRLPKPYFWEDCRA
jgi:hypothetical protein